MPLGAVLRRSVENSDRFAGPNGGGPVIARDALSDARFGIDSLQGVQHNIHLLDT